MLASLFIIGFKHDTIFFLQRQHQFKGVDRIQCQAIIGKKQGVVADLRRRDVFQIHRFDDEKCKSNTSSMLDCHVGSTIMTYMYARLSTYYKKKRAWSFVVPLAQQSSINIKISTF